jgi:WD40 repeat protein
MRHGADRGTPAVLDANWSPSGERIATGSADLTARIWDGQTHAELRRVDYLNFVTRAVFSRDGRYLLTASDDGTAEIRDGKTSARLQRLVGHRGPVESVELSRDRRTAVTAGADGTVRLWDVRDGQELATQSGSAAAVRSATFSPGGSSILTRSDDGVVRLYACDVCGSTEAVLASARRLVPGGLSDSERRRYLK